MYLNIACTWKCRPAIYPNVVNIEQLFSPFVVLDNMLAKYLLSEAALLPNEPLHDTRHLKVLTYIRCVSIFNDLPDPIRGHLFEVTCKPGRAHLLDPILVSYRPCH